MVFFTLHPSSSTIRMSVLVAEKELPKELTAEQSVEAAYARELAEVASKLQRKLPCLIECDKDMAPFVFSNLRARLRETGMRCVYLDGRRENEQPQARSPSV